MTKPWDLYPLRSRIPFFSLRSALKSDPVLFSKLLQFLSSTVCSGTEIAIAIASPYADEADHLTRRSRETTWLSLDFAQSLPAARQSS